MRYWIDGESRDIEDDRVSARVVELNRFGRPTTAQRSELQQLLTCRSARAGCSRVPLRPRRTP